MHGTLAAPTAGYRASEPYLDTLSHLSSRPVIARVDNTPLPLPPTRLPSPPLHTVGYIGRVRLRARGEGKGRGVEGGCVLGVYSRGDGREERKGWWWWWWREERMSSGDL